MTLDTLNRDIEFLYEIGCIRHIQRQWRQFLNHDFANLAEHTLRVTWIAITIGKHEKADINKIVKLALVHDLSESRSVDVHYLSRQYVTRNEADAVEATLADTAVAEEYIALWHEYEARQSLETKIVKDADNLDVDLELREQKSRGATLPDDWFTMRQHVADHKLYTETAKKMWQAMHETNPNSWHLHAQNRFNGGDWKK